MNHFYAAKLSNGKYLADTRYYLVSTENALYARRFADKQQLKDDMWLQKVCYDFQLTYEIKMFEVKERIVEVTKCTKL